MDLFNDECDKFFGEWFIKVILLLTMVTVSSQSLILPITFEPCSGNREPRIYQFQRFGSRARRCTVSVDSLSFPSAIFMRATTKDVAAYLHTFQHTCIFSWHDTYSHIKYSMHWHNGIRTLPLSTYGQSLQEKKVACVVRLHAEPTLPSQALP